jgi:hypothetical protein
MASLTKTKKVPPPKPSARKDDPVNAEYEEKAKALIKFAMSQRGVDFEGLAEHLASLGVSISPGGIANKISRGGFSTAFLLQCMEALDINVATLPR